MIVVRPVATTTYTLAVTRGGDMQSLPVTVTVDPDPVLGAGVAPAFSDGTAPVQVCWQAPVILDPRAGGTTDSPGGISGGGLTVTDSAADFTGQLVQVAGGDLVFELDTPVFLDNRARVASFTGTQLTLESPVATTLNPDLAVVPTNSVGDLERCYEASNTAAQAVANDDTRWAVCDQPSFLGDNGGARFEEPGTETARFATPVAVSDAKVPGIELAYEFSATIGNARVWYGGNTPHERNSTGDATLEFWLQPSGLANGEQIVCEWGGADDGSYLALVDDTLNFVIDGEDGPGGADVITTLSHTLTNTDWIQVVCVYKNTNDATANDSAELWVDGQLVDSVSGVHINDWAGNNPAGIGNAEAGMAGGPVTTPVNFEGLIARVALYNPAFTASQILQNYVALTRDASAAVPLADGGGYTVSESLGIQSLTLDDDDATTPSPLFTTNDPGEIEAGCFDAGVVAQTTTYTVTATGPLGSTARTGTVSVGGAGTSFGELVQADAPLAWYRFDEAAGSPTIFDSSGNGHHATIFTGDLVLGATGPVDGALDLGGNQVIELPIDFNPRDPDGDDDEFDGDPDGVEGFTIEALVYLDVDEARDPYTAIASQQDLNGTGRTVLEVVTGSPRLRSFIGGAALETAAGILDDAWAHYAFVCKYNDDFSDYEISFYKDGVHDETFEGVLVEGSDGRWQLGTAKALVSDWNGLFDEVAFYLEALPEATLKAHADAFISESQIGLLAFGPDAVIGAGGSTELTVKTGGGMSGSIDQGVGAVGPGLDTVTVSPTGTTDYTLTVGGETRTVTVSVLGPIRVLETGINDGGFFFMTVANLLPDRSYDLSYSADLESAFTSFGVSAEGAGETPVTFTDTLPASSSQAGFYRLDEMPAAP